MPGLDEMTTGEVAKIAGVTQSWIRDLISAGKLEVVRVAGHSRNMISRQSVRRWLEESGRPTKALDLPRDQGEYLHQCEIAKALGVSKTSIHNWLNMGLIPTTKVVWTGEKGRRKVLRKDFEEFCARNGFVAGEKIRRVWPERKKRGRKSRRNPNVPDLSGFISQVEAASRCGLSQARITALVRAGRIPSVEVRCASGKIVRKIRPDDLERFAEARAPHPGLKLADVADRLGVSYGKAYDLVSRGEIKGVNHGRATGNGYRIDPADLEAYIKKRIGKGGHKSKNLDN
jgi:excisionase family DNA binding protein